MNIYFHFLLKKTLFIIVDANTNRSNGPQQMATKGVLRMKPLDKIHDCKMGISKMSPYRKNTAQIVLNEFYTKSSS